MQQRIVKRIGNDIFVNLPIYERDGQPFANSADYTLEFELLSSNTHVEPIPVTEYWFEDGNRLCFWVLASEITAIGWYDFRGKLTRPDSSVSGGVATHEFDVVKLIRVVEHSEWIGTENTAGLYAMLDMYALSAYHSYVRTTLDDPILTEKEWVDTLKLRYEDLTDVQLTQLITNVINSITQVGVIIKEDDATVEPTDENVFSAKRTLKEISRTIQNFFSTLDDKFIRKDVEDEAAEVITFLKGIVAGGTSFFENVDASGSVTSSLVAILREGFQTGEWGIDKYGDAVLNDVLLRQLTATERANLQKGFKTGSHGMDAAGNFTSETVTSSEAVLGNVTLLGGAKSPVYIPGMFGEGFSLSRTSSGKWAMEVDDIMVRGQMILNELTIHKISHVGGAFLFSPASGEIAEVEEYPGSWKITVKDVNNFHFELYDNVICQNFTGIKQKRYWRGCNEVHPEDGVLFLGKTDCEAGSAIPEVGDEIITFGNKMKPARQNAILISSYGETGPYMQFFSGLDYYDLLDKVDVQIGGPETFFTASKFEIRGNDGKKKRVPREMGAWTWGTTYEFYDRVRYNGAFWLCMVPSTGVIPDEKRAEWVKETDVKVGGKNLLREYDIRFDFKYWGGYTPALGGNYEEHDLSAIMAGIKYLQVAPRNVQWVFPEFEQTLNVTSNTSWTTK